MVAVLQSAWLAVALPLVLALVIAVAGRVSKPLAPLVALIGPSFIIVVAVGALASHPSTHGAAQPWTSALAAHGSIEWFAVGGSALTVGWAIDSLAALMLLVVGVVSLLVIIFSVGYMRDDRGWARYFALLSLFAGAMALLVMGDSFLALFVGWELVGACSYLLIGFWYERPAAAAAAVKAFLTTRIGDVGLLLGISVLAAATGSIGYTSVMAKLGTVGQATVTGAAILLAIGAIGKSAQFPLHVWLPDAMEGPTPVSALIHAATMVAAGVYLVARVWPVFEAAPAARTLLLTVGVISASGAAVIALVQTDIKRVLAYSTISQLGFMFAALGVGAWRVAFFHLMCHAAFKALLFLGSGSVIHGSGTQDLREMGGLRRLMPVTFVTWLVGAAALMGIPPFAGFFSKDAVIDSVWAANPGAGLVLLLVVALTGYYVVRATKLAFFGAKRGEEHAHESPLSMLAPMMLLALPGLTLGFGAAWVAETLGGHQPDMSIGFAAASVLLALLGGVLAWRLTPAASPELAPQSVAGKASALVMRGLGFDAAIDRLIVGPTVAACRTLWAVVDRLVIDGSVEGSALASRSLGEMVSQAQGGDGQGYAAFMVLGVVVLLALLVLLVGWAA